MDELRELKKRMSQLSDGELLQIVTEKSDDYRKEAVDFAKSELRSRGVDYQTPLVEDNTDSQEDSDVSVDPFVRKPGVACPACGGPLRNGTLLSEREVSIVFSDNREERFIRVTACGRCGLMTMLVDYETDVKGS